jgi:type IV pilus assembly protein PilY1
MSALKYLPRLFKTAALVIAASLALTVWAAPPYTSATNAAYPAVPPNISSSSGAKPMLMLAASKDHTLFGPIYTDFEDLDLPDELGYGELDTGFKPTFKYYGYFDPTKCYAYSTTDERFNPAANAILVNTSVTGLLLGVSTTQTQKRYTCTSAQSYWSGNFLNWASTMRMDVVRKMLYGGKRSTDTASLTVLERAGLNWDAHSFTKYYGGNDIRDYTPYTTTALTKTTGTSPNLNVYAGLTICQTGTDESPSGGKPIMKVVKGNYRFWNTVEIQVCRYSNDSPAPPSNAKFSEKLARYYKGPNGTGATTAGLVYGGGAVYHEVTLPSSATDGATYGGIGPTFTMRVKACDASWLGEERCQAFPPTSTTNYKPYGLFQEFGFSSDSTVAARAEFGVIGGSYDKNVTGGALRKNMGDFADEINATTGVFCHSPSSGCAATLASPDNRSTGVGAIKTFDSFLLYGRTSSDSYGGTQSTALSDGTLPAWGNPIGEMLVQALQYYAYNGTTPTPSNPTTTTKDTSVGLPTVTWSDPLSDANTTRVSMYGKSICRRMYALALSSSSLSFDNISDTAFETLPNRSVGSISAYTDKIGVAEGLSGTLRSVGSVAGAATQGDSCSGKTIGSLSTVNGVCPDAPAMMGTYKVAGAALYANTSKIRTLATEPPDLKYVQDALRVKTLTASLSGGAARIDIPIPGTNPKKYVYITPESLWSGDIGAALTFVSVSSSATHGAFIVTWNDALMGGDYDMDLTGFLRYDIVKDTSTTPATYDVIVTTDVPNNCGGKAGTHGFSIIGVTKNIGGTTKDGNGRYLTHQHYNPASGNATSISSVNSSQGNYLCGNQTGDYSLYRSLTNAGSTTHLGIKNWQYSSTSDKVGSTDTSVSNAGGACKIHVDNDYCSVQDKDFQIQMRFKMVGAEDAVLKDPLWYAAKYGDFASSTKVTTGANAGTFTTEALPPNVASWDAVDGDGKPGADGTPDGYYLARRPDQLEDQLRKALSNIIGKSNSSPATSSTSIQEGSFKYISNFNKDEFYGTVEAKPLLSTGQFSDIATWDAGMKLAAVAATSRTVITNDGNTGVAWQTSTSFTSGFTSALLGSASTTLTSTQGDQLINYLRGDRTQEVPVGIWRKRKGDVNATDSNLMGMVVNSTPWLQTIPVAENIGALPSGAPSYASFITAQKARDALLWVGSNDGMLHSFKATGSDSGSPIMSYVPSPMVGRLGSLAQGSTILAGMDGSPFTGDVLVGSSTSALWKTYLFSSLGRGGRAVFALDVTTPSALTEGNASSIYKWMFSSTDDADLGYIISEYQKHPISKQASPVVRMNNGKYAILVPNGIGSASGRAYLYVLFVDGPGSGAWTVGTHYIKIPTDALGTNGLMGVNWADTNNNGTADLIYGTDLLGRVWKFDVSSVTPTDWKSAFLDSGSNPIPLFEAKSGTDRLSITTSPVLTAPDFGGIMVHFGTGRAISSTDFPDATKTQRAITVYDRFNWTTPSPRPLPNSNLSTMHKFTLKRACSTCMSYISDGGNVMFNRVTEDGYYHNFPAIATTGTDTKNNEMVMSSLVYAGGEIKGKTVRPNPDLSNYCDPTPLAGDFSFNPLTGLPTGQSGTVDVVINGVPTPVYAFGGSSRDQKSTVVLKITGKAGSWATLGANELKETPTFLVPSRRQWREIPGMRSDQ